MTRPFEIIVDLTSVYGGFNAGKCFDDTWPWAAGGAALGAWSGGGAIAGAVAGGVPAAATSVNCGNGTDSPATMLRNAMSANPSSGEPPGGVGFDGAQQNTWSLPE